MKEIKEEKISVWWFIGGIIAGSLAAFIFMYLWVLRNIKW